MFVGLIFSPHVGSFYSGVIDGKYSDVSRWRMVLGGVGVTDSVTVGEITIIVYGI